MTESSKLSTSKKIRVVVADDHAVLRSGLRLLINTQADMEVVGEAGGFGETQRICRELRPDVLSLDLNMPDGPAAPTIETLARELPGMKILVLTMHDDAAYLKSSLAAGAHGFVVKKSADTELLSAIRALAQGRAFIDLESITKAESSSAAEPASDSLFASLSEREREVFRQLALGHTNQAIADRLVLSVKTVESYRSRLMTKLGCRSRADLTRRAIEAGLLTSEPREN
ncbi:MAG: response regulator transcription factor [Planctomycetia bacterium]|nr:response regulator transcription factor [Planctomycetia bacterium]